MAGHELQAAITAANEKFVATFGRGDAAGLAAHYTEDGQLLPPNSEIMVGHEAIQAFWQAVMDMGLAGAKLQTVELFGCGEMAVEIGKYQLFAANRELADHGKYIVIWQQADGQWKLHRDIFSSSAPAAGT